MLSKQCATKNKGYQRFYTYCNLKSVDSYSFFESTRSLFGSYFACMYVRFIIDRIP